MSWFEDRLAARLEQQEKFRETLEQCKKCTEYLPDLSTPFGRCGGAVFMDGLDTGELSPEMMMKCHERQNGKAPPNSALFSMEYDVVFGVQAPPYGIRIDDV